MVTKIGQAEKWLKTYLSENGKTESIIVKQAAYELGIERNALSRAANRLGITVSNYGFPRTTYWEI